MNTKKQLLTAFLVIFSTVNIYSAVFEYNAEFDGWIDNREVRTPYVQSKTFITSMIMVEGGFLFDSVHRIRLGLDYYTDFGRETDWKNLSPTLYYQFSRKNDEFVFGRFNRSKMRSYPTFLISDSLVAYRPHVEGLVYEKRGKIGKQNLWLDWVTMLTPKSPDDREAFLTGFSGEFNFNAFYFNYYFMYYHLAHSTTHPKGESVEHYGGLTVDLGKSFTDLGFIDSLDLKIDGKLSYSQKRFAGNSWHTPFGISLSTYALLSPKWAVRGEYYRGFWSDEKGWHKIPVGDQIYNAKDYGLLGIVFMPFNGKHVSSELRVDLYFVDGLMDSRQVFKINAKLGGVKKRD